MSYPKIINYKKVRTYTASICNKIIDSMSSFKIAESYADKIEEKEILEELRVLRTEVSAIQHKASELARISRELLERKESEMTEDDKQELAEHIKNFNGRK